MMSNVERSNVESCEVFESYEAIYSGRTEIDWDEVETKISILCRKFNNIDERYRDDLAQELRIHAMMKSDDFYDLQRRAIDFWRSMQRKVYPEVPFIDLELVGGQVFDTSTENLEFIELVKRVREELDRDGTVAQRRLDTISSQVLDIILEDFDYGDSHVEDEVNRYINGRINCTYLATRLPEVHYKVIRKAVKNLEEILGGLMLMQGKIMPGFEDCTC